MYITNEGKRTSISNLRLFEDKGIEVLVSYQTPVAYAIDGLWHYTSHKYSRTTSNQITRFLNARIGGRANALEVNQDKVTNIYNKCFRSDTSLSSEFLYG